MKCRRAVLLLLALAFPLHAELHMADAVFCDVEQNGITDKWMSWAAADANLIQAWQDVYYGYHDQEDNPPHDALTSTTRGEAVYHTFLSGWKLDGYSYIPNGLTWWFQGGEYQMPLDTITMPVNEIKDRAARNTGYYNTLFGPTVQSEDVYDRQQTPCFRDENYYGTDCSVPTPNSSGRVIDNAMLKNGLDAAFAYKGQAAALGIYHYDTPTGSTYLHALTCWGYEADENGQIHTLYVTDSDDGFNGIVKLGLNDKGQLLSDSPNSLYAKTSFFLKSVTSIITPEKARQTAEQGLAEDGELRHNTALNGSVQRQKGIVVGKQLILAAAKGSSLSIDKAAGTALRVEREGFLSLRDTTISGAGERGMDIAGQAEISAATLSVSNNAGGIRVSGRLSIEDTEAAFSNNAVQDNGGALHVQNGAQVLINGESTLPIISFTDNSAAGKGGAVYNEGRLFFDGLKQISFSGNTAAQGSAIDNEGIFSLRDVWQGATFNATQSSDAALIYNGANAVMELAFDYSSATFSGSGTAIENDGLLYLAADEGTEIFFRNGALRSKGLTYLGMDGDESLSWGQGLVWTAGEQTTAVGSNQEDDCGVLRGAELAADHVKGLNEQAELSRALLTTDKDYSLSDIRLQEVTVKLTEALLCVNRVSLDAATSLTADSIVLNDAVLTLPPRTTTLYADADTALTLDLEGIFCTQSLSGSLTLVQEGLLDAMKAEGITELLVDFGEGVSASGINSFTVQGLQYDGTTGSTARFVLKSVPEPCAPFLTLTGALLLLRRRRKI